MGWNYQRGVEKRETHWHVIANAYILWEKEIKKKFERETNRDRYSWGENPSLRGGYLNCYWMLFGYGL